MNPDDLVVNGVSIGTDGDYKIVTAGGLTSLGSVSATSIGASSLTMPTMMTARMFDIESFLDEHIMNRLTVDHKVQEQELLKLKEVAPDYANEIKDTIAKNAARDMVKKLTFTKKHDKDADVHHFIGRVWMFTEDELKNLIKEARSV
jgi:hypothetical protein